MTQIVKLHTKTAKPAPSHSSVWHTEAMEKLVSVEHALSRAKSLDGFLAIVRLAARDLTGADGTTFVLRDGEQCYYAEENAISPLWKGQRFPMAQCVSGWVMQHREAVYINDIYKDPRAPQDAYRPTFVKSLMMVPIRHNDPMGALGNYWARSHDVSLEEMRVLQILADKTAAALKNIGL